jgi:hypothetical protein
MLRTISIGCISCIPDCCAEAQGNHYSHELEVEAAVIFFVWIIKDDDETNSKINPYKELIAISNRYTQYDIYIITNKHTHQTDMISIWSLACGRRPTRMRSVV